MENSKVTSLGKPEVQAFIVLTSKLKSMKQKKKKGFIEQLLFAQYFTILVENKDTGLRL